MAEIEATNSRLDGADREAAFARLVESHHADLLRVAYVVCGDRELAADAVQSAWHAAWRQVNALRDPAAARAWLLAITMNQARRHLRRQWLRRRLEPMATASSAVSRPDLPDLDLATALAHLSARDRELVALRYLLGMTSAEIGRQVGMSASGVRVRLARVLARLREELTDG